MRIYVDINGQVAALSRAYGYISYMDGCGESSVLACVCSDGQVDALALTYGYISYMDGCGDSSVLACVFGSKCNACVVPGILMDQMAVTYMCSSVAQICVA